MARTKSLWTAILMGTLGIVGPQAASGQMPGAVPERHLLRIGFGGGMSVPTSGTAEALEKGINGQAFLLIDTGFIPPLRLNLGYQKFDLKEMVGGGPAGDTRILSGVAAFSMDLFKAGPVRPYVMAGLGAFSVRDAIEGSGSGTTSESTTKFGIDGGAGLAFKLGRLEAFVEGRVQNIYTEAGAINAGSIRAVPVTFGVLF